MSRFLWFTVYNAYPCISHTDL